MIVTLFLIRALHLSESNRVLLPCSRESLRRSVRKAIGAPVP